ncbi:hypothetical protein V6N12_050348 [Hibiscus sabdariffa]|uniref:RNase H type-1 domain-containing protein n=1 Tax=Hibiscus sabdariffa TaxID=183260 RepID=A0ABR2GCQ1_9ROSI
MTKKKMEANSGVSICRCGQQADVVTAWTDENPESEENGKVKIRRTNMLVMCIGFVWDDCVGLEVVAPGMMKDAFQVAALEMMEDAFRIAAAGMMDVVFL